MEISLREIKGYTVVDVKGEVFFMETQKFMEQARKIVDGKPDGSFVFNFSECPHMGTLGLGLLQQLHKEIHARGQKMKIMNLDETGRFRLEETSPAPPFHFIESEDRI